MPIHLSSFVSPADTHFYMFWFAGTCLLVYRCVFDVLCCLFVHVVRAFICIVHSFELFIWFGYVHFLLLLCSYFDIVFHPRHKLAYFKCAKWEQQWIDTAETLVRKAYKQHLNAHSSDSEDGDHHFLELPWTAFLCIFTSTAAQWRIHESCVIEPWIATCLRILSCPIFCALSLVPSLILHFSPP